MLSIGLYILGSVVSALAVWWVLRQMKLSSPRTILPDEAERALLLAHPALKIAARKQTKEGMVFATDEGVAIVVPQGHHPLIRVIKAADLKEVELTAEALQVRLQDYTAPRLNILDADPAGLRQWVEGHLLAFDAEPR